MTNEINKVFPCETDITKIKGDTATIYVELRSPLHLGSGQADVNVDAEVVHDAYGVPFFPGKRLKGILYESALEITEMAGAPFTLSDIDSLFGHDDTSDGAKIIIPNLCLEGGDVLKDDLKYLLDKYPETFTAQDVLESFTTLRYQTKIDPETGTAADTSLHNMRAVKSGLRFSGEITIEVPKTGDKPQLFYYKLLALALRNLEACGLKRTRGFGRISCILVQNGKNISDCLIEKALAEGGKN